MQSAGEIRQRARGDWVAPDRFGGDLNRINASEVRASAGEAQCADGGDGWVESNDRIGSTSLERDDTPIVLIWRAVLPTEIITRAGDVRSRDEIECESLLCARRDVARAANSDDAIIAAFLLEDH